MTILPKQRAHPEPGSRLYRGNRTEILFINHKDFGECVEKRLLPFCDVSEERKALKHEAELQRGAAQPGTVEILGQTNSSLFRRYVAGLTLSEYAAGLAINSQLQEFSLSGILFISQALCHTLRGLHEGRNASGPGLALVHRDLTPSNTYITERGQILLSDFGLAYRPSLDKISEDDLLSGSPRYLAPELAQGSAPSPFTDIYQLGLLIAWMIEPSFRLPQPTTTALQTMGERLQRQRAWHEDAREVLREHGWDLALHPDPQARPTAPQFLSLLSNQL